MFDRSSNHPLTDLDSNEKYKKIFELILKMVSMKYFRPKCDEILKEKSSWALHVNEIENEFSELSSTEQSIEESFHKFFIKTKLIYKHRLQINR